METISLTNIKLLDIQSAVHPDILFSETIDMCCSGMFYLKIECSESETRTGTLKFLKSSDKEVWETHLEIPISKFKSSQKIFVSDLNKEYIKVQYVTISGNDGNLIVYLGR